MITLILSCAWDHDVIFSLNFFVVEYSPSSNEVGRMFDLNQIEVLTDPKKLGKTMTPHAIGIRGSCVLLILRDIYIN